jgi:ATP-binding cassette subfamily A (ABC1) protein 3
MEETEALCTRMGIMVNGELKCLGNLQTLKTKYGDGYTLLVKVTLNQSDIIEEFIRTIRSHFKQSILKENRNGYINMQIKDNSIKILGDLFTLIEEIKTRFHIECYFVSSTKLEQIFLSFASRQIDPATRFVKNRSCEYF